MTTSIRVRQRVPPWVPLRGPYRACVGSLSRACARLWMRDFEALSGVTSHVSTPDTKPWQRPADLVTMRPP